jgi:hypothetical protein
MQPQMTEARGRHNLSPQPDRVSSDIGEIKQWLREVTTHERSCLSSLWIEAPEVVIMNSAQGVVAGQRVWYTHLAKDK